MFLASIGVDPSVFTGGQTTTGRVTASKDAEAGGFVVTLSSSEPANATPPATVTVPQGATTATFPITTRAQTGDLRITITGVGGGETRTALLRLTAPAAAAGGNFTVTGDFGDNICIIKNAAGDLDCRIFAINYPGNSTFEWSFTIVGGTDPAVSHDSTDPATKPEDGCVFLGQAGAVQSVDGNGDRFIQMTIVLRILQNNGTLGPPSQKTVSVYTRGNCGY